MNDVKVNFKSKYKNNMKCRICKLEDEDFRHLFECVGYRDKLNLDDDSDPEWINGNNLKRIETVTKKIIEIEKN